MEANGTIDGLRIPRLWSVLPFYLSINQLKTLILSSFSLFVICFYLYLLFYYCVGPMMHGWYKALDAAIPSASVKASIVKLCLDQSIAAPTLIASFFVVVGVHSRYAPLQLVSTLTPTLVSCVRRACRGRGNEGYGGEEQGRAGGEDATGLPGHHEGQLERVAAHLLHQLPLHPSLPAVLPASC